MTVWSKFTSWLSGWPESKSKKEIEQDFIFAEEEELKKIKTIQKSETFA